MDANYQRIQGNYGVYRTRVRIGSVETSSCTCPSEEWPCKHVRALVATWKSNPDSFYNLEALLTGLADEPTGTLIKMIAAMVVAAQNLLPLSAWTNSRNPNTTLTDSPPAN